MNVSGLSPPFRALRLLLLSRSKNTPENNQDKEKVSSASTTIASSEDDQKSEHFEGRPRSEAWSLRFHHEAKPPTDLCSHHIFILLQLQCCSCAQAILALTASEQLQGCSRTQAGG